MAKSAVHRWILVPSTAHLGVSRRSVPLVRSLAFLPPNDTTLTVERRGVHGHAHALISWPLMFTPPVVLAMGMVDEGAGARTGHPATRTAGKRSTRHHGGGSVAVLIAEHRLLLISN